MRTEDRQKAVELRIKDRLGYGVIAKRLNVPKSTLSYWLKDLPLSEDRILELRREAWSRGIAGRELFRKTMREKRDARDKKLYEKQRKRFIHISTQSLFVAGLMLYLAEGTKKNDYSIGIANTDSRLIKFFIWWLRRFLKIPKSKVRMQLHLYETMDISGEKRYWLKETGLTVGQLYKDQVRKVRPGSFTYPESFRHGTCQIYVHGRKYKSELSLSIKAFLDTYSEF